MGKRGNAGFIGVVNNPTSANATGIFTTFEQNLLRQQGKWPGNVVPISYLVIAGGGSGGTYTNPSGYVNGKAVS